MPRSRKTPPRFPGFPGRLADAIRASGFRKGYVARHARIEARQLSRYLKGESEPGTEDAWERLAVAVGVGVRVLKGLSDGQATRSPGDPRQGQADALELLKRAEELIAEARLVLGGRAPILSGHHFEAPSSPRARDTGKTRSGSD